MTQREFIGLPELLTRRQVVECGVPDGAVDDLRVVVQDGAAVAFGKLGAVQLPGRRCLQKTSAKYKYRKADVARICGYKTE